MWAFLWAWAAVAGVDRTAEPGEPQPGEPHYDLEEMYRDHQFDEGLKLSKERLAANPDDIDLYWHVMRFMYEVGERYERDDKTIDKEAFYEEMGAVAQAGLDRSPGHPHLIFGRGLANARLGTTRGVLASLWLAQGVEQDWTAAANAEGFYYVSLGGAEELPCDAMLSLAVFYRLVPESKVVQAIAGTRGDIGKSVEYATRADQCSPGRVHTTKELGAAQLCYGQRRKDEEMMKAGFATLARGVAIPPKDPLDKVDIKHMGMLIAEPKMACEYSRDGQQDLDEKQLEKQQK
jgi:hypothetical protein